MSSIQLKNVSKFYGSMQVLHGIDLDISDQEFVVLVGPSGCGKSTLLRMIAGLEEISSGDVLIDGDRVNDVSPQKRDLSMVFQSYALYPHMTVAENMGFSLSLRGAKKNVIEKEVGEAAKILHLEDYLDRQPKNLSGGQRQRVAMGRAIVRHPKAFLFDEPLSNLDAKLRTHMRAEIRQLHQTLSATSVYVTHDQIEAMTLADRIVVMNGGRIEQVGTPIDLFDFPSSKFVAGFIGAPTMNFFEGIVTAAIDGKPQLSVGAEEHPLPLPETLKKFIEQDISIGVRPQHLDVENSNASAPSVTGIVSLVEQTGCETNLLINAFDQQVTVQTKDRVNFVSGDSVSLQFNLDHLHIFDRKSGRRIN